MKKTQTSRKDYEFETEFSGRVRMYQDRMSRTDRQIANYLLRHESNIEDYSIHTLADSIGIGVASIVRFSKTLGYKGFADMKFQIQQGRILIPQNDVGVEMGDDVNLVKQKLLQFAQNSLEQSILNADNDVLKQISLAIASADKVYLVGSGTSGYIAAAGASMFLRCGIYAVSVSDSLLHLRVASYLREGDVMIALNYSGDSKDIGDTLYYAQASGATTVLLTSIHDSLLAQYANQVLYTAVRNQSNSVNISTSAISQLTILQVILAIVQQMRISRIEEQHQRLNGQGVITRYDPHQKSIYPGKMRVVREDSNTP